MNPSRFVSLTVLAAVALATLAPNSPAANAWAPPLMQPGIAAMTCSTSGFSPNEFVYGMVNIRDAVTCGTPIGTSPFEWNPPAYHHPTWTVARLGEVFGVDVGEGSASDVYLTSLGPKPINGFLGSNRTWATANSNTGNGGEVFKIDGTTGAVTTLASLPNHKMTLSPFSSSCGGYCLNGPGFVGLGQVSFCALYNTLYVSNLDDGLIYVLDATSGAIKCTLNHGLVKASLADNPALLYTQRSRMVFGLEYHPQANRLFYALRNALDQDEIFSVALDSAGCPTAALPCLEYISAPFTGPSSPTHPGASAQMSLPGDIQFSPDGGRMLVVHVTVAFEDHNVLNVTPTIPGLVPVQKIPLRSAHAAVPYECTRPSTAACGGWTYKNYYRTGQFVIPVYCNAVAGDYGYNNLLLNGASDSVVIMAETIRNGWKYGMQINPLGDYTRTAVLSNFDIPLLAGSGGAASKVQLNDLDVLHMPACMKLSTANIKCPTSQGGPFTLDLTITNISSVPAVSLNLTPCQASQLPPGAITVTPNPVALPGGILMPGNSATVPVSLPGLPITGGKVCFCVSLINEAGQPPCTDIICVDLPNCYVPCMQVAASNIQCITAAPGGYTMNLTITNLQAQPVKVIDFLPCSVPAGAISAVPSPSSITLGSPLLNGQSTTQTVTFTGVPLTGVKVCFCVALRGVVEGPIFCQDRICIDLPKCPEKCVALSASNILCPQNSAGSYSLTVTIVNNAAVPAHGISFTACPASQLPTGATSVTPLPGGYVAFGSPLPPSGGSTTMTLTLPGIPCTGGLVCFCATLFSMSAADPGGHEGSLSPICEGMLCVQLPACQCPPCIALAASNIRCPDTATGSYLLNLQITNLSGSTAFYAGLTTCPSNQLPAGASTYQPLPGGLIPLSPPLASGASTTIPIQLPAPLTGGKVCFCVALFGEQEGSLLCRDRLCIDLPACACAQIVSKEVICLPNGQYQITVTVKNNTSIIGSPFNFVHATFNPTTGFTPGQVTVSGSPIVPGATGTFAATYSGPWGAKCVNIVFSNASDTRCCEIKVCFDFPPCEPTTPPRCELRDLYVCEKGVANVLFYLINTSGTPQAFSWNISPVSVAGCTGTLPAAAFSPSSGITGTVGPFSGIGVNVVTNTSTLLAGQCAGFRVCFQPVSPVPQTPICCTGIIKCPKATDPCIVIGDIGTALAPGRVVGLPIVIKNPTDTATTYDLVVADATGDIIFLRAPRTTPDSQLLQVSDTAGVEDPQQNEITADNPLQVLLGPAGTPGSEATVVVYAEYTGAYRIGRPTDGIVVGPPCVRNPNDNGWGWGTGRLIIVPPYSPTNPNPRPPIGLGSVRSPGTGAIAGIVVGVTLEQGQSARFEKAILGGGVVGAETEYLFPVGENIVTEPDGSFMGTGGTMDIGILMNPALDKEFYHLRFRDGLNGLPPGTPVIR